MSKLIMPKHVRDGKKKENNGNRYLQTKPC